MKQIDEKAFNEQVGVRVRQRRKELGLRQEELAKALNRNANTVSGIENGKYMASFPQAVLLAASLDCSLDWLAGVKRKGEQPLDPFASLPLMQKRVMTELNALTWKDQREVLNYIRYMAFKRSKGENENADEQEKDE